MTDATVRVDQMAAGGDAIARDASGRVIFVEGALPGETVRVEVVQERKGYARGRLVEVVDASPDRTDPPCAGVGAGCGGCNWQHVQRGAQVRLKRDIVLDALRRTAHLDAPEEVRLVDIGEDAQRTTVRAGVVNGRAAFRKRHSHDLVGVEDCLVAHPLVAEVLADGRFPAAEEIVVRAGAATGDRIVVAAPRRSGVRVPDGVVVVSDQEVRSGAPASISEVVRGRTWRVSALSFFQSGPRAAEAIATEVVRVAALEQGETGTVVDLYAGVGLLGGCVAASGIGSGLVAVESDAFAVADARANLRDLGAAVVRREVGRWRPQERDVSLVIADPARTGLGRPGVAATVAGEPGRVVLVACDPASFGRDSALLAGAGYRLDTLSVVDCFPHTSHVEIVAGFAAGHVVYHSS